MDSVGSCLTVYNINATIYAQSTKTASNIWAFKLPVLLACSGIEHSRTRIKTHIPMPQVGFKPMIPVFQMERLNKDTFIKKSSNCSVFVKVEMTVFLCSINEVPAVACRYAPECMFPSDTDLSRTRWRQQRDTDLLSWDGSFFKSSVAKLPSRSSTTLLL
jgi:hypothetical protein